LNADEYSPEGIFQFKFHSYGGNIENVVIDDRLPMRGKRLDFA